MADDFIDRLRAARFPTARRGGYDPEAVDAYLRELADWLETGGDDQTRAALVRREMERVGERTGGILAAAQESAESLLSEARAEAASVREAAEREAGEARSSADEYAVETRRAADEHVRLSAEAAARETSDLRTKAEAEAQEKLGLANARLQEAEAEAKARTAGVEKEIADLVRTRDGILGNLEQLTSGIRGVVEGPGGADLEIPEDLESAIARAESETGELAQASDEPEHAQADEPAVHHYEPEEEEDAQEHELPTPPPPPPEGSDDTTTAIPPDEDEDEATVAYADDPDAPEDLPVDDVPLADEGSDAMVEEFDTEERERARREELERRRSRGGTDPPAEDSDLNDPLL